MMAQVASCGCGTKPAYWDAHAHDCLFRILQEAVLVLVESDELDEVELDSAIPQYTEDEYMKI